MLFSFPVQVLILSLSCVGGVFSTTECHDENFVPDAILRVTQEEIAQSCLPAKSTVLVNGTSPGPELRLLEGKTYWIRVYNDMEDANVTMVIPLSLSPRLSSSFQWLLMRGNSIGTASQWPSPPSATVHPPHPNGPSHQPTSSITRSNPGLAWQERISIIRMWGFRPFPPQDP